jgi:hypothetical protein
MMPACLSASAKELWGAREAHIVLVSCNPLGDYATCRTENTGLDRGGYDCGRHSADLMSS